MKRLLVVAMALLMAVCSLAMVGCGKEGVSYEDFKAKATAVEANAPEYTKGTVWFKFSGDDDWGADITFDIVEKDGVGEIVIDQKQMKDHYHANVWEIIPNTLDVALFDHRFASDELEVENKKEKTERGDEFKTTVVYQIEEELSFKVEDYMKTVKGNEATSITSRKYDISNGYLVEYFSQSNSGVQISFKIEWKAN